MTAWDEVRPPELDLIKDCVHCGFCLPTCPSYTVFEEEMDSPRGRIVLMRIGHEEGSEVSQEMTTHLDRCLGCMACVTACPSGVQYDRLIERARPQIERHGPRSRRIAARSGTFGAKAENGTGSLRRCCAAMNGTAARSRPGWVNSAKIPARSARSQRLRGPWRSSCGRARSISRSYWTPDGQAVTHAMQPRQRSRCVVISCETSLPSS